MDRTTFRYVAAAIASAMVGFFPFVRGTRVPVLGQFDFGMHELGHMLFIWAGETIHFAAGSVTQVVVPLGLALYFGVLRRDLASAAFLGAWTGASLWDVSVYVADAPYERLQLIGGDHDWAFLLFKYDAMNLAAPLAAWLRGLGGLAVVAAIGLATAGPWVEEWLARRTPDSEVPAQVWWQDADTADESWM